MSASDDRQVPRVLLPREHGSWGMLLFPFVSAAVLARAWTWNLLPATLAVVAVFLIREPLLVLARQRYLWKDRRPETAAAVRSLWVFGVALAVAGVWLVWVVSWPWLVGLGLAAAALTAIYIYGALRNLQRSPWLQIAGAVGLAGSALLPGLIMERDPGPALWLLAAVHVVHSCGSVLVVHARLDAVRALKAGRPSHGRHRAPAGWLVLHGIAVIGLWIGGQGLLALGLGLPLIVHAADLWRLGDAGFLNVPLRRVGFRELGLSTVFSVLVIVALL